MESIIQEDQTGYGLASIATLAGIGYQDVKTVADQLGIDVQDPRLWSDTRYMRTLLAHYGFSASRKTKPFTSWNDLPPLALLAIKWHKQHDCAFWHWVVFQRGLQGPVVFDPKRGLRTHCRTDFGRITPEWFLTVTIPQEKIDQS